MCMKCDSVLHTCWSHALMPLSNVGNEDPGVNEEKSDGTDKGSKGVCKSDDSNSVGCKHSRSSVEPEDSDDDLKRICLTPQ